jgi:hypothetical protein
MLVLQASCSTFSIQKDQTMSMHLVKPYLTTTQYNRRKKQTTNKRTLEATVRHEQWLKTQGLDDKSLANKLPKDKKGKRKGIYEIPDYRVESSVKLSNAIASNGSKKEEKVYTGDQIAGISTMHKSNIVPVRKDNKEAAIDIARMRR